MSVKQGGKTIAGATQYHPDLFDFKRADHILNDAQWLMADTFSWQYGSMYQAAYPHLAADIVGKTLQSETVAGITVQFYLADDGHKICPDSEEDKVLSIYNKTGNAWYYIIDTINQRFKLPRRHSQKIVRSVKNADGSWYRLYADGWVEQGGETPGEAQSTALTINLPVIMANSNYYVGITSTVAGNGFCFRATSRTTTTFVLQPDYFASSANPTGSKVWQVSGQSAIDMSLFQDGEKYLYFYVGAFTQTAIENTAGLNTELFNQKADLNLNNTASNIDFVIERQEPTAANNYTWYRKYKSGWVEQGGLWTNPSASSSNYTQTLLIEMADNKYQTSVTVYTDTPSTNYYSPKASNRTTTTFVITANASQVMWQVSGMAA